MPSVKEIKNRIKSVKDTQKITNAMYLIASTKLRKAKLNLAQTQPYFLFLRKNAQQVLAHIPNHDSKYFLPENKSFEDLDKEGKVAILCITADKGLAGTYNHNIIKETVSLLDKYKDCSLFVIGEYGRAYFRKHGIKIDESFLYTAREPNMDRARKITGTLLEKYDQGEIKQFFIIYTEFDLNLSAQPQCIRALPLCEAHFEQEETSLNNFEIVPSPKEVLDTIVRNYITGFVYSGIVESYCAEQNSRMMAMDSANQNAKDLISELNIKYNKGRQSIITREITEISSGAKSLNQIKEALN